MRRLGLLATVVLAFLIVVFGGCVTSEPPIGELVTPSPITQEEAIEIMAGGNVVILDVRTPDEFDTGYIPGAVNLPIDELSTTVNYLISDKEQIILIYCRSGVRSADALRILINMGYWNAFDFGGILSWTGEIMN